MPFKIYYKNVITPTFIQKALYSSKKVSKSENDKIVENKCIIVDLTSI